MVEPARLLIYRSFAPPQRQFHAFKPLFSPDAAPASPTSPSNPTAAQQTTGKPAHEEDHKHAAYLGEADSDDGFETWKDTHGKDHESMDGSNAAFLGEADSDDGFESHKDVHGQKVESVDASQSAFLGEGDSDDGFESDVEINPDKYRHKIDDAAVSGEHGQPGEGDGEIEQRRS